MNENNPVSLRKLLRRCDVVWRNFNYFLTFTYLSFGRKPIDWISDERHRNVDFDFCRVDSFSFEWIFLGLVNLPYRKKIQTNAF